MSSSTTLLDQVSDSAALRERTINELFGAAAPAFLNGRHDTACSMLTFSGYGGVDMVGGVPTVMPNWSLNLTASSICYIRKEDATGEKDFVLGSGSPLEPPTNWPKPYGGYTPLFTAVTGPSTVLTWDEHRFGGAASSSVTVPTGTGFPHITSGSQDAAAKTYAQAAALLGTNVKSTESIIIAASDETTALTTGVKCTFRMPYAFTVTGVRASLTTAQTSGSTFTVDIHESGTTILSTKLTLDNTEKTSTTAAAAVISDSSLADDAEMTIEVDQIGDSTAKGLKVSIIGNRT